MKNLNIKYTSFYKTSTKCQARKTSLNLNNVVNWRELDVYYF